MATGVRGNRIPSLQIERTLKMGKGSIIRVVNSDGTESTIDLTELAAIDSLSASELAVLDGVTKGTGLASKALTLDASGNYTGPASGLHAFPGNLLPTEAGAGVTGGTGTVYKSAVSKNGGIFHSRILLDLTGLASSTTDLDIIGVGSSAAHIGQVTAARNGTIFGGTMTCLEVPAGGVADIDLYWATEGTGVFDALVTSLTETALITAGGAWTLALTKAIADPVGIANGYLYVTGGAGGTAATYTAGKFLIDLYGY